ncbi:RrF2 family transcriptional regulator [Gemmatirosa kalamazoonensis]|uniref:RrF2 family transcriptional regulator n=1 Tax=Gemmatirosa kalamazoonensis TaxID=861299 RepID=UPI0004ACA143|nr:Rrf2 family transcriptional regulator [Gemmatirosa kalamazoonensis]
MLSNTAEYALRAVLHLAGRPTGAWTHVSELARTTGVPRNYLSKTLNQLARAGVLRSTRGPSGGFRLAGPASELTLDRVVAPFMGLDTARCLLHDHPCGDAHACEAHTRWAPVARQVHAFFGATTVADLTGGAEGAAGALSSLHRSVIDGDTP